MKAWQTIKGYGCCLLILVLCCVAPAALASGETANDAQTVEVPVYYYGSAEPMVIAGNFFDGFIIHQELLDDADDNGWWLDADNDGLMPEEECVQRRAFTEAKNDSFTMLRNATEESLAQYSGKQLVTKIRLDDADEFFLWSCVLEHQPEDEFLREIRLRFPEVIDSSLGMVPGTDSVVLRGYAGEGCVIRVKHEKAITEVMNSPEDVVFDGQQYAVTLNGVQPGDKLLVEYLLPGIDRPFHTSAIELREHVKLSVRYGTNVREIDGRGFAASQEEIYLELEGNPEDVFSITLKDAPEIEPVQVILPENGKQSVNVASLLEGSADGSYTLQFSLGGEIQAEQLLLVDTQVIYTLNDVHQQDDSYVISEYADLTITAPEGELKEILLNEEPQLMKSKSAAEEGFVCYSIPADKFLIEQSNILSMKDGLGNEAKLEIHVCPIKPVEIVSPEIKEDAPIQISAKTVADGGIVFNGTAQPDSILLVQMGGETIDRITSDAEGRWSWILLPDDSFPQQQEVNLIVCYEREDWREKSASAAINVDTVAPMIEIIEPLGGIFEDTTRIVGKTDAATVKYEFFNPKGKSLGGQEIVPDENGRFTISFEVAKKDHYIIINAMDAAGNAAQQLTLTVQEVVPGKPTLLNATNEAGELNPQSFTLCFEVEALKGAPVIFVDNKAYPLLSSDESETAVEGKYSFTLTEDELLGLVDADLEKHKISFGWKDAQLESWQMSEESYEFSFLQLDLHLKPVDELDDLISGTTLPGSDITGFVNGKETVCAIAATDGSFELKLPVVMDRDDEIIVRASDKLGRRAEFVVELVPVDNNELAITAKYENDQISVSAYPGLALQVICDDQLLLGDSIESTDGVLLIDCPLEDGDHTISVSYTNEAYAGFAAVFSTYIDLKAPEMEILTESLSNRDVSLHVRLEDQSYPLQLSLLAEGELISTQNMLQDGEVELVFDALPYGSTVCLVAEDSFGNSVSREMTIGTAVSMVIELHAELEDEYFYTEPADGTVKLWAYEESEDDLTLQLIQDDDCVEEIELEIEWTQVEDMPATEDDYSDIQYYAEYDFSFDLTEVPLGEYEFALGNEPDDAELMGFDFSFEVTKDQSKMVSIVLTMAVCAVGLSIGIVLIVKSSKKIKRLKSAMLTEDGYSSHKTLRDHSYHWQEGRRGE